jgi:hypothetical protein
MTAEPVLEQLGQAAGELIALAGDLGELLLKFDDAADGRQRHAGWRAPWGPA